MPIDDAERLWKDFASRIPAAPGSRNGDGAARGHDDPGTVFFTKVDGGTTEITIQLDPDGIASGDELEMNERIDSFLERFKAFAEER